ncbi:MAG TPA: insulinase family protein [Candidatus Acidoferrum sp.]|nr:insulinase family protein [Candidatus Acidoferrum sp.]
MKHTVEEVVLTNGSRGLLIHVPGAMVVSYDFEFRAGHQYVLDDGIYETPHIMEHMVLGANEQYPNSRLFNAEIEKNGAFSNAFTDTISLKYVADCAEFEWDRVLDLMRLSITKPLFLASEFKAESGNVNEELTGFLSKYSRVLWQQIAKSSGERFLDDGERLKTMPKIKLRDIKEHYARTHTSDNMRFVIAGNFAGDRRQQLIAQLEKWQLPRGERFGIAREELVGSPETIHILRKDVETIMFGLSVQANWRFADNEKDAMNALNHILTGTLHSLILGEAREKGLVYGMWSDFFVGDTASEWDFGGQVSLKNAPQLFEIITAELQKVLKGEIKQSDLAAAKQFALGKHQMGCQTVGSIANWHSGRYFFDGYIKDYASRPKAIEAVTKEMIVAAANALVVGKRWAFGGLGNCSSEDLQKLREQLAILFV